MAVFASSLDVEFVLIDETTFVEAVDCEYTEDTVVGSVSDVDLETDGSGLAFSAVMNMLTFKFQILFS